MKLMGDGERIYLCQLGVILDGLTRWQGVNPGIRDTKKTSPNYSFI